MARLSAIGGLVIVLIGALVWWQPFVTEQRVAVTSTPSPGPAFSPIPIRLKPGSRACVEPVAIDPTTARAQVALSGAGSATVALLAEAPGYRHQSAARVLLAKRPAAVELPIAPPARTLEGKVCVVNTGRARVNVLGTNELPAIGLARTSVDGQLSQDRGIALNLFEAHRHSLVGRLGTSLHRASDLTGGLMPFWLAWLLVVVLVIGTPFAVFAGYAASLRDD
jgi:hypothetical protein